VRRAYSPDRRLAAEGRGVSPDIEVKQKSVAVRELRRRSK